MSVEVVEAAVGAFVFAGSLAVACISFYALGGDDFAPVPAALAGVAVVVVGLFKVCAFFGAPVLAWLLP